MGSETDTDNVDQVACYRRAMIMRFHADILQRQVHIDTDLSSHTVIDLWSITNRNLQHLFPRAPQFMVNHYQKACQDVQDCKTRISNYNASVQLLQYTEGTRSHSLFPSTDIAAWPSTNESGTTARRSVTFSGNPSRQPASTSGRSTFGPHSTVTFSSERRYKRRHASTTSGRLCRCRLESWSELGCR